jgi:sterol desaturase/sphingolipid hydroxylase (fatty acid hydroxylase superfamily)
MNPKSALREFAGAPPPGADTGTWLAWAFDRFRAEAIFDAFQYLLAAGLTFLVLWMLLRRRWAHRRIVAAYPEGRHLRREFLLSISTVLIFGLIGTLTALMFIAGWSRIYLEVGEYGWFYLVASVAVLLVVHDAYFYWTHRAMHSRALYKYFHLAHHRSVNPSPFAAYAFAPAEAFVQGVFLTLMFPVLPLHPIAILAFIFVQVFRNAVGHSGFEVFPRSWRKAPVLRWLNTNTHHHLHHMRGRGNFGLYFLWWDRWCGTEHPETASLFDRAAGRPAEAARP